MPLSDPRTGQPGLILMRQACVGQSISGQPQPVKPLCDMMNNGQRFKQAVAIRTNQNRNPACWVFGQKVRWRSASPIAMGIAEQIAGIRKADGIRHNGHRESPVRLRNSAIKDPAYTDKNHCTNLKIIKQRVIHLAGFGFDGRNVGLAVIGGIHGGRSGLAVII